MKIKEFLDETGLRYDKFCEKAGISASGLNKVFQGADIRVSTAYKIIKATKGKVRLQDLLPCKSEDKKNLSDDQKDHD